MRAIFACALAAALATCSGASSDEHAQGVDEVASDVESREPVEEAEPRPYVDPATECGRALACCRAFCGAVPNAVEESACAGVFEALESPDADARCRSMCEGWRQALERLSEDGRPPPECAVPAED